MELSPNFMFAEQMTIDLLRTLTCVWAKTFNIHQGWSSPPKKNAESILAIPPTLPESPNQPLELYATVLKVHVHTCRLQQQLLADFSWWVVTTCLNCQRFSNMATEGCRNHWMALGRVRMGMMWQSIAADQNKLRPSSFSDILSNYSA